MLGVYLALDARSKTHALLAIGISLACVAALFETGSRGAFLAIVAAAVLCLLLRRVRLITWVAIVVAAVVAIGVLLPADARTRLTALDSALSTSSIEQNASFRGSPERESRRARHVARPSAHRRRTRQLRGALPELRACPRSRPASRGPECTQSLSRVTRGDRSPRLVRAVRPDRVRAVSSLALSSERRTAASECWPKVPSSRCSPFSSRPSHSTWRIHGSCGSFSA